MFHKFKQDYFIFTNEEWTAFKGVLRMIRHRRLRFCFIGRLSASNHKLLSMIGEFFRKHYEKQYGLEIYFKKIRGGVLLLHPYNITVSPFASLGKNVILYKGATIGSVRSGKRSGVPTIGNRVVIGLNATVVGDCHIGNDVLIAANSFVDIDVPDHSLVFGNPAIIKFKKNASKDYLRGV